MAEPLTELAHEVEAEMKAPPRLRWRTNLVLFLVTCASAWLTSAMMDPSIPDNPELGKIGGLLAALAATVRTPAAARHGAEFTASLLAILLAHEFGHYFAARWHKVDATLPFFIPMPLLSPFGTMGAVIRMRGTIKTRRALMDIGASGPLAGLALAIPLYVIGQRHSTFAPLGGAESGTTLGESVALRLLEKLSGVTAPEGMDLVLSPMAFAAWAGMFVTMINLIPAAQLDGGHVAYALFGRKQDGYARVVHRSMLAFFLVSVGGFVMRDVHAGIGIAHLGQHVKSSLFWLVWFEVLAILGTLGLPADRRAGPEARPPLGVRPRVLGLVSLLALGIVGEGHDTPLIAVGIVAILGLLIAMEWHGGAFRQKDLLDHPPTSDHAPLDPVRRAIAVVTLIFFALLFMPAPFTL
jgi:membrane-associated protease RseP (regulator of RpoE activity)